MSAATVNVWGFDMAVEYDYSPEEKEQKWGDYPHPGCPAAASISSVVVGGVDIYEMLDSDQLDRIEEKILEESGDSDLADYAEDDWQRRQDRAMEGAQ